MSAEQALALLDQVCQSVQTTRQGHIQIQEAIRVIREDLQKSKT